MRIRKVGQLLHTSSMKTVNQSKSAQYTLLYLQVDVHRVEKENTTRSTTESVAHASGGKSRHTQVIYF